MSRINTNVSSMVAVNVLNKNNSNLQTSLQRLSTGYRINSGKDDPAGLIASESLRSEQMATQTAISNAQRADNVVATADGGLGEVSNLLTQLTSLVSNSANSNSSALASDHSTPEPTYTYGRSALASSSTASAIAPGSPALRTGGRSDTGAYWKSSAGIDDTSYGRPITTGPSRPVRKCMKARRMMSATCPG